MGIVYSLGGKVYDYLDEHFEKTRYEKIRKKLACQSTGMVLDAGCGTGRNFPHFHPKADIVGVDNSSRMLAVAKKRAAESKAAIRVKKMDLRNLNFGDSVFDSIVATFVLCVMPKRDEQAALKELVRVAKPGAKMYFLEYVYSKDVLRRTKMKLTAILPRILYNMRFNTTLPVIKEEKRLKVEKLQFVYDDVIRLIVAKKV